MIHIINHKHNHRRAEAIKQAHDNLKKLQNAQNSASANYGGGNKNINITTNVNYYQGNIPCTSDPVAWFTFADKDKDGFMSQEEAIASINVKLCPKSSVERLFIRKSVQQAWVKYDTDFDTYISQEEFISNDMISFVINLEKEWKQKFIEKNEPVQNKELPVAELVLTGPLPDLSSRTREWYEQVDTGKKGMVSQEQMIRGLHLTLKPNSEEETAAIKGNVRHFWHVFDVDHNGLIDKWEFLTKGGMGDALKQMETEWNQCIGPRTSSKISKVFTKATRRHSYEPPPSLRDSPEAWFDHFDIDDSHFLSQKEVIHGLYITCNALTSEKRQIIREHVVSNWDKYDQDNNGVIDKVEFLKLDGFYRRIRRLLKLWPQTDNCVTNNNEGHLPFDAVEVTVCIPKGKGPGDIIKMSSPKTQEFILVMVPEKKKWLKTSDGGADSFIVLF